MDQTRAVGDDIDVLVIEDLPGWQWRVERDTKQVLGAATHIHFADTIAQAEQKLESLADRLGLVVFDLGMPLTEHGMPLLRRIRHGDFGNHVAAVKVLVFSVANQAQVISDVEALGVKFCAREGANPRERYKEDLLHLWREE